MNVDFLFHLDVGLGFAPILTLRLLSVTVSSSDCIKEGWLSELQIVPELTRFSFRSNGGITRRIIEEISKLRQLRHLALAV